jgi:hypothetical protein
MGAKADPDAPVVLRIMEAAVTPGIMMVAMAPMRTGVMDMPVAIAMRPGMVPPRLRGVGSRYHRNRRDGDTQSKRSYETCLH